MYCETCPVRDHCEAYKVEKEDNRSSYHPQDVIRVDSYFKPPCPLLAIVEPKTSEEV